MKLHFCAFTILRLRQQEGNCFLCGNPLDKFFTRDHLIPRSKDGSEGWSNIVLADLKCNQAKSSEMPTQAQCEKFRLMTGHWPSPSLRNWVKAETLLMNRNYRPLEGPSQ